MHQRSKPQPPPSRIELISLLALAGAATTSCRKPPSGHARIEGCVVSVNVLADPSATVEAFGVRATRTGDFFRLTVPRAAVAPAALDLEVTVSRGSRRQVIRAPVEPASDGTQLGVVRDGQCIAAWQQPGSPGVTRRDSLQTPSGTTPVDVTSSAPFGISVYPAARVTVQGQPVALQEQRGRFTLDQDALALAMPAEVLVRGVTAQSVALDVPVTIEQPDGSSRTHGLALNVSDTWAVPRAIARLQRVGAGAPIASTTPPTPSVVLVNPTGGRALLAGPPTLLRDARYIAIERADPRQVGRCYFNLAVVPVYEDDSVVQVFDARSGSVVSENRFRAHREPCPRTMTTIGNRVQPLRYGVEPAEIARWLEGNVLAPPPAAAP